MAVTIKKIAELSGVSIGTVDRVINNRGHVNPEVELRIRKIIKEVNYTPNLSAKSLAIKKNPPTIGVIFHLKNSSFFNEVMRGFEKANETIKDFGIKLEVKSSRNFDSTDQVEIIDDMISRGIKAIAITPINDSIIINKIDELVANGYPVYCFINDVKTINPHPFIGNDAYEIGQIVGGLFKLLAQDKNEKIAILTPRLKMLGHIQKIEGFKECLKEESNIQLLDYYETGHDSISTYKATLAYLEKNPDITALWYAFSGNDGAIKALKEHDLLHKIKIICLDKEPFIETGLNSGYISATVSQNPSSQGYNTIKSIFNALLTNSYDPNYNYKVPCSILIKENFNQ